MTRRSRLRSVGRVVPLFLLVAVVASVIAVSSASGARKAAPFKVLAILPMSGPLGFVGGIEKAGMQAAVKVVNGSGGILGHPVQLTVLDGGGDGNKTVSVLQQALASGAKYNLISCGSFDQDAIPCTAALKGNKTLQIPLSAATILTDPKTYPNVFITSGGFVPNAEAVILGLKKKGYSKIGIVSADDTTGHSGADALNAAAKKMGVTVTTTVFVPDNAADATPQLQQLTATNPQALAIEGFAPAVATIIKTRSKLGLTNLPLFCGAYVGSVDMAPFTTAADRKNIFISTYPYLIDGTKAERSKPVQDFLRNLYAIQPKQPLSVDAPIVGYYAIILARGAALKAKSTDGTAMAKALGGIRLASQVPGMFGTTKLYGPGSHFMQFNAKTDYVTVNAGILNNGLLVPDK